MVCIHMCFTQSIGEKEGSHLVPQRPSDAENELYFIQIPAIT